MSRRTLALLLAGALLLGLLSLPLVTRADEIPPITHTLDGRDDCLSCHKTGGPGAGVVGGTGMPNDHASRQSRYCAGCHQPATAQPTPTRTSPSPTPVPTRPSAASPSSAATPTSAPTQVVRVQASLETAEDPPASVTPKPSIATTVAAAVVTQDAAELPSAGDGTADLMRVAMFFGLGALLFCGAILAHWMSESVGH